MRPATARRETVIIVHDDQTVLRFLTDGLERAGMTVLIATNARDARALLGQVIPKAILTGLTETKPVQHAALYAAQGVVGQIPVIQLDTDGCLHAGECEPGSRLNMLALLAQLRFRIIAAGRGGGAVGGPIAPSGLFWIDVEGRLFWASAAAGGMLANVPFRWFSNEPAPEVIAEFLHLYRRAAASEVGALPSRPIGDFVVTAIGAFPASSGFLAHIGRRIETSV